MTNERERTYTIGPVYHGDLEEILGERLPPIRCRGGRVVSVNRDKNEIEIVVEFSERVETDD